MTIDHIAIGSRDCGIVDKLSLRVQRQMHGKVKKQGRLMLFVLLYPSRPYEVHWSALELILSWYNVCVVRSAEKYCVLYG